MSVRKFFAPVLVCGFVSLLSSCQFLGTEKVINAWDLVPRKSFAVLEATNIIAADSIFQGPGFSRFVDVKKAKSSAFLYTFQALNDQKEYSLVISAAEVKKDSIQRMPGIKKRSYEGRDLLEVKTKDNKNFIVVYYEGFCHISSHSIIAEEVVRQYKASSPSFEEENPKLFGHPALQNDLGNVYLNWQELSKVFKKDSFLQSESESLSRLCQSAVMDLQLENNAFLLSGFGIDSAKTVRSYLNLFHDQTPVPVKLLAKMPDQFSMILHMGLTNPVAWYTQKLKFQETIPDVDKTLKVLRADYTLDDRGLMAAVDDEIIKIRRGDGDAVVVELKEVTKATAFLNQFVKAAQKKEMHRSENYASQTIHSVSVPDVGYAFFWPLLSKATHVHFTIFNGLLVMSNSEELTKQLINEMDGENTIGKSLAWQRFLANAQEESNLTLVLNNEDKPIQYAFNKLILQFTRLDRNYYSSAFITFDDRAETPTRQSVRTTDASVGDSPIRSELFSVVNHNNQAIELLAQDQSNNLILVDGKNQSSWRRKLDGPVAGKIHQIDFLKNGKLQYLVATPGTLSIVDRLGRDVEGYSVKLSQAPDFLSVVDYNHTKDYRFMVSNKKGNIFLFDKKGKTLEGWAPKSLNADIAVAPRYFRIAHKDYFAAVSTRGDVFLYNRKGETAPGFPLSTRLEPSGDLFGTNQHLIFCSKDGHVVRITPKGRTEMDEVLLKNGKDTKFGLSPSQDDDDFITYRLERGQLGIFDSNDNLLFDVANPASENLVIRYHTYGSVKVVSAYDVDQQIFFLLDLKGKLLLSTPLESSAVPAVTYSKKSGSIQVFTAKGALIATTNVQL